MSNEPGKPIVAGIESQDGWVPDVEGGDQPDVPGSNRGCRTPTANSDRRQDNLQAAASHQIDLRVQDMGAWRPVDGVASHVTLGALFGFKLLGIYNAEGELVIGADVEITSECKDSRIESFSLAVDGDCFIAAAAEARRTGTYERSLSVAAGAHLTSTRMRVASRSSGPTASPLGLHRDSHADGAVALRPEPLGVCGPRRKECNGSGREAEPV